VVRSPPEFVAFQLSVVALLKIGFDFLVGSVREVEMSVSFSEAYRMKNVDAVETESIQD
jgi:hypothetical protein